MNTKTISQLKTTITSRLHGTTLNKISDFYTLCRDTAEVVLARIDLQETRRKATLANAVYDKVCDYSLPFQNLQLKFKMRMSTSQQQTQHSQVHGLVMFCFFVPCCVKQRMR